MLLNANIQPALTIMKIIVFWNFCELFALQMSGLNKCNPINSQFRQVPLCIGIINIYHPAQKQ